MDILAKHCRNVHTSSFEWLTISTHERLVFTMKKRFVNPMTMMLNVTFLVAFMPLKVVEAKSKPKLSTSKRMIQDGKTYDLKLKNAKKVKWKTSNRTEYSCVRSSSAIIHFYLPILTKM